jgi:hypothetical protein
VRRRLPAGAPSRSASLTAALLLMGSQLSGPTRRFVYIQDLTAHSVVVAWGGPRDPRASATLALGNGTEVFGHEPRSPTQLSSRGGRERRGARVPVHRWRIETRLRLSRPADGRRAPGGGRRRARAVPSPPAHDRTAFRSSPEPTPGEGEPPGEAHERRAGRWTPHRQTLAAGPGLRGVRTGTAGSLIVSTPPPAAGSGVLPLSPPGRYHRSGGRSEWPSDSANCC